MSGNFDKWDFLEDFLAECREHLAKLNQELMDFEKDPSRREEILEAIGRELHTLKAASRMMGFKHIEGLSHKLEDLFESIGQNRLAFHSQIGDIVLDTLDGVEICLKALPSIEVETSLEGLLANIDLALEGRSGEATRICKTTETSSPSIEKEEDLLLPSESAPEEVQQPLKKVPSKTSSQVFREENAQSVRVHLRKLDHLMDLSGELVMYKARSQEAGLHIQQIEEKISSFKQEWRSFQKQLSQGATLKDFKEQMEDFLQGIEKLGKKTASTFTEGFNQLNQVSEDLRDGIMELRMVPLKHLFEMLPRMMRDLVREESKPARLILEGENIEVDRKIMELLREPLIHMIRNAISHGIETPEVRAKRNKPAEGTVSISARREGDQILIEVKDDGGGIDPEVIKRKALAMNLVAERDLENLREWELLRFIFLPGFSTRDKASAISGRGIGMDIVEKTLVALKGTVGIDSKPGEGTIFSLRLPLSLATTHVLLTQVGPENYAIPIHTIREILQLNMSMVEKVENKDAIHLRNRTVPLVDLATILKRPFGGSLAQRKIALILSDGDKSLVAFGVDKILGEQEIVSKSLGNQVQKVRHIQGGSILREGEVILILNSAELLHSSRSVSGLVSSRIQEDDPSPERQRCRILVVDDSITTRRLEKAILDTAGYLVDTAVHGEDALNKLKIQKFDLIISDVQMPVMDGLELTRRIKKDPGLQKLPVIIVSSLDQREDKEAAFSAGASGYITKGEFNQENLITLIEELTQKGGEG